MPPVCCPRIGGLIERLFAQRSLQDAADHIVVVEPLRVIPPPPAALYDPSDLDRVTASHPDSTMADEWKRLEGVTSFGPLTAYRFDNVMLSAGKLVTKHFRHHMVHTRPPMLSRSEPERPQAAFVTTAAGSKYFGHFLTDDLVSVDLAEQFGPPTFSAPGSHLDGHREQYRQLAAPAATCAFTGKIRQAWIFRDAWLTDSKVARIHATRERVLNDRPATSPDSKVYIRRRSPGIGRAPLNETQLETVLTERHGWTVIDPSVNSMIEIVDALAGARIVAGVEGSQMDHTFAAMAPGGALVHLQPPAVFNMVRKEMCDRVGYRYGFHVGHQQADGWTVDIDGFLRLIERVDHATV
jgi:Glycosyltransferase 61